MPPPPPSDKLTLAMIDDTDSALHLEALRGASWHRSHASLIVVFSDPITKKRRDRGGRAGHVSAHQVASLATRARMLPKPSALVFTRYTKLKSVAGTARISAHRPKHSSLDVLSAWSNIVIAMERRSSSSSSSRREAGQEPTGARTDQSPRSRSGSIWYVFAPPVFHVLGSGSSCSSFG